MRSRRVRGGFFGRFGRAGGAGRVRLGGAVVVPAAALRAGRRLGARGTPRARVGGSGEVRRPVRYRAERSG
ncbi:hypothetical protein [Pseudonocardia xinjiangensis]|uniref:DUF4236 domain-containing protein n=1 Tax=Pseudonocardia xinjiangensis TaxID=75289 RepID=A0ABX1RJJ0_9PSEU|nr:hypothetical protein [Pseudonocardia xinjiangensis]NMH80537.1 hypothetical protein [Pseudonocardia xinjiangensis]